MSILDKYKKGATEEVVPAEKKSSLLDKYPSEEEVVEDSKLANLQAELDSKYGGDITVLSGYSDNQIIEMGKSKGLNQPTVDRLRDLAKAYRLTVMVSEGKLEESFLLDEENLSAIAGNGVAGILARAIKDAEYKVYLAADGQEGASLSQVLAPEYSKRSETGSGFSQVMGVVDDALSIFPRAARSGITAATSDASFAEEMARPGEYKTGPQAMFDEIVQPNFLLNAPVKGALKGVAKGVRRFANVADDAEQALKVAKIVKGGAKGSTKAQSAVKGMVSELPIALQEAAFDATDENGGAAAGAGTFIANMAGAAGGEVVGDLIKKGYNNRITKGLVPDGIDPNEIVSAGGYDQFRDEISDAVGDMSYAERARYMSGDKARSELDKAVTQSDEIVSAKGKARDMALSENTYFPQQLNAEVVKNILSTKARSADKAKALKIVEEITNEPLKLSELLQKEQPFRTKAIPENYSVADYVQDGLGVDDLSANTKWDQDLSVRSEKSAKDLGQNRTDLRNLAKQGSGKEVNVDLDQSGKDVAYNAYKDATDAQFLSMGDHEMTDELMDAVDDPDKFVIALAKANKDGKSVSSLYQDMGKASSIKTGDAVKTAKAAKLPDVTDGAAVDKYLEKISSTRMNPKKLKGSFQDLQAEQDRINAILREQGKKEVDYISPAIAARVTRSGDFKTFLENTTGVNMSLSAVKKAQKAVLKGIQEGSGYGVRAMNAVITGLTEDHATTPIPTSKNVKSYDMKKASPEDTSTMSEWQKYVAEKGGTVTSKNQLRVQ